MLCLLLAACTAPAQTNTGFAGFTQPFNPAVNKIQYTTTNYHGLFRAGDPIGLATSDGSSLNVFAWYGDLLYSGPATTLTLPVGHYFVEVNGDRNQFAVLPADWPTLSAVGWSGSYQPDSSILSVASFLKFGWVRASLRWDLVQAAGSKSWDWTYIDQIINAHYGKRKMEIDLVGTPDWIRNPVTGVWKVTQNQWLQLFSSFAQAVAARYSDKIDVVEVWNEPATNELPATTADLDSLYVSMLAAVHAAFPSTVKVSGPVLCSPELLGEKQTIADGGGTLYLDYETYHDYDAPGSPPDTTPTNNPAAVTIPQRVQQNWAIFQKPIIVDEVGLYGQSALGAYNSVTFQYSGMNWATGMTYAVKYAVMYAANNVVLMPHVLLGSAGSVTNNEEILGFDVNGRGPHPKTTAFLMSEYWLSGSTLVGWRSLGQKLFLYAWQRPDNTSVVFAWVTSGQSASLSSNVALNVTDIYGRSIQPTTLGDQPILFHANSPDAAALLNSVMAALPNLNLPPVFDPLGNQSTLKNQSLQFTVSATDPDNDSITYSADSLPPGATLDATTGTFSWTPDSTQIGAYQITFTATDARGLNSTVTTLISVLGAATDGLIAQWKFDETAGTTASDSVGTNNGTLLSFNFKPASGWTTGKIGNALALDGVNDYVSLDSNKAILTNNFTISAWLNPRDAASAGVFICVRSSYQRSGFKLWVNSNELFIDGQTTAGYKQTSFAAGRIQDNNWYHIVVVYDKSTFRVYVNGVTQTAADGGNPNWGGDFVMDPNESTRIGAENGTTGVGFFYNGLVDDVRIYNRTLIPAEVQALYQAADQPPVLASIGAKTVAAGQSLAFMVSATDPDSSSLTYSADSLPSGAALNATTGAFSWTPSNNQTGTYNVTFTASDGLLTSSQAATITVSSSGALITAQANPSSGGTVSGGGFYLVGAHRQIAATPNSGWTFAGWGDGNMQNPRTVTVTSGGDTYTANLIRGIMPTTSGMSVTNPVMQFNNLAVVVAGDTNVFTFDATNSLGNTLYYTWTFGDGTVGDQSTNSTPTYVYTNCGPYTASVTVDDGITSTNASFTVSVACQLAVNKLQGNLKFAQANADSCTVKGAFDLPPDYNFADKLAVLDIGGAEAFFILDSNGRGRAGSSMFKKQSYNTKTGLWTFNATLKNGSWQIPWAAYGLANTNVPKPGLSVSLPVTLIIDNESFMATPSMHYTAQAGKLGTAR